MKKNDLILIGEEAENNLQEILDNPDHRNGVDYYPRHSTPEDGCWGCYMATLGNGKTVWVAYDNSDECCWAEDFDTLEKALKWIKDAC